MSLYSVFITLVINLFIIVGKSWEAQL